MTPLERIEKLIATATGTNANENEARNAALVACRLIKQHGVKLSMSSTRVAPDNRRRVNETDYRNVRTRVVPEGSAEDVMKNGTPVDLDGILNTVFGRDWRPGQRSSSGQREDLAQTMNAPQDGVCKDCGGEFRLGDRIWHRRGHGSVHHMKCRPEILNG